MTSGTTACSVIANQAGNDNYSAAPQVTNSVTALKASQAIVLSTPVDATFGTSFTATVTSSGASGNAVIFTNSGGCSNVGALYTMTSGTTACSVIANQAGNDNYSAAPQVTNSVTALKANPTINVVGFTGLYDTNAHGATGTATGVGGANLNASLNLGTKFTNFPGGTAHWTFTGGTNYNDANGDVAIVINKQPASVTPNDASKSLGASDPVPLTTGTLSGFIASDGVTATYSRTMGDTVAGSPYTISATLSPTGALGNYDITYNTAKFTITYGVCLLFDNSKAVQKNATIPIKLNLCDVNGVNVSSSAVVLSATNLVWSGVQSAPEVQDSGNANPDDNFRFTGGSYLFNLSTKNLWSGKWGLEFKANGDSLSHIVSFNVK